MRLVNSALNWSNKPKLHCPQIILSFSKESVNTMSYKRQKQKCLWLVSLLHLLLLFQNNKTDQNVLDKSCFTSFTCFIYSKVLWIKNMLHNQKLINNSLFRLKLAHKTWELKIVAFKDTKNDCSYVNSYSYVI